MQGSDARHGNLYGAHAGTIEHQPLPRFHGERAYGIGAWLKNVRTTKDVFNRNIHCDPRNTSRVAVTARPGRDDIVRYRDALFAQQSSRFGQSEHGCRIAPGKIFSKVVVFVASPKPDCGDAASAEVGLRMLMEGDDFIACGRDFPRTLREREKRRPQFLVFRHEGHWGVGHPGEPLNVKRLHDEPGQDAFDHREAAAPAPVSSNLKQCLTAIPVGE